MNLWEAPGQDLEALPSEPRRWRVVACLNVWQDIDELRRTLPSWIGGVDHVIAVDGPYAGTEGPETSDDGTLRYLEGVGAEIVSGRTWADQRVKRSEYFTRAKRGDLLFIVDADESVQGAEVLRDLPDLDVGWVTVHSPLYQRSQHQPRIFRWQKGLRYDGRHHWIHVGDQLLASHQQGGVGVNHMLADIDIENSRGAYRSESRRRAVQGARVGQDHEELSDGPQVTAHEPLRILHVGPFDAGHAVHRLHTAINTTTPHTSAMAVGHEPHPHQPPKQHDIDSPIVPDLVRTADIVHHHVLYMGNRTLNAPVDGKLTVMHHHGTEYRRDPERWNQQDRERNALRLVSNVELLQYGEDLHWLPNPVPVRRYNMFASDLRPSWHQHPFRVGHSPSKPEIKGTETFLRVCERIPGVEPVLIQGQTLRECLELKATCHAFFDSFDLGIQCSGLEAAAMGIPVLAGDLRCHMKIPDAYLLVSDEEHLAFAVSEMVTERDWYEHYQHASHSHVMRYHDYAAVTARYLDLLDAHFQWRNALGLRQGMMLPMRAA